MFSAYYLMELAPVSKISFWTSAAIVLIAYSPIALVPSLIAVSVAAVAGAAVPTEKTIAVILIALVSVLIVIVATVAAHESELAAQPPIPQFTMLIVLQSL